MILQDYMIKRICNFISEWESLTKHHLPVKSGEYRHCGSGDVFNLSYDLT